jgi:plasmid stabilization system protein ParE
MALPIRWAPKAAHQLEAIVDYIAQDSERYAAIFAHRILQIVGTIPANPDAGRVVPEYGDKYLREKIHLGYRIVYRLNAESCRDSRHLPRRPFDRECDNCLQGQHRSIA